MSRRKPLQNTAPVPSPVSEPEEDEPMASSYVAEPSAVEPVETKPVNPFARAPEPEPDPEDLGEDLVDCLSIRARPKMGRGCVGRQWSSDPTYFYLDDPLFTDAFVAEVQADEAIVVTETRAPASKIQRHGKPYVSVLYDPKAADERYRRRLAKVSASA